MLRKLFSFFCLLSFIFTDTPVLLAQSPASALPLSQTTGMIGVVAGVNGEVRLGRPGEIGTVVDSGTPVYLGQEVRTDGAGQLQILLLDETVFTVGPNSSIVIDEFVYDPATQDGRIDARVVEGLFRMVTGRIAKKKPENVEIKLPTGSVGIRGTIVYGKVDGDQALLLLLGPGEKNNTGARPGAIVVENAVDGKVVSERVEKSGFGSEIRGSNIPPTPAFKVPESTIRELTAPLDASPGKGTKSSAEDKKESAPPAPERNAPEKKEDAKNAETPKKSDGTRPSRPGTPQQKPAPSDPRALPPAPDSDTVPVRTDPNTASTGIMPAPGVFDSRDSAASLAGQDFVRSLETLQGITSIEDLSRDFLTETQIAAQDAANQTTTILSGVSTFENLRTIQSGKFHYKQEGVPVFNSDSVQKGDYSFYFDIDFGARTVGGGNSRVEFQASTFNSGSAATLNLEQKSYDVAFGSAAFDYSFGGPSDFSTCSTCTAHVNINILNSGESIGTAATHRITATDPVNGAFTGAGVAEREDGQAS